MKRILLFIGFCFVILSNYAQYKLLYIDIKMETTTCINKPVKFKAVSDMPFNATYLYNFGDGSTSTEQNPSHTYSMPGTYQVTLIVTDVNGCTGCSSQIIQIAPECCVFSPLIEYKDNLIPDPFPIGTTTWTPSINPFNNNNIIRIEKTLTIPAGSHLKLIEGIVIEFGPFGKIIVERGDLVNNINGGILELGKCTLTSINNTYYKCPVMWQGIEVWGFSNIEHFPSINQSLQGKVIVNGAYIENAHNAVLLGRSFRYFTNDCNPLPIYKSTPYLLEYSGGIIDATGGYIVNNAIGVHFAPYKYNNSSYINGVKYTGGTLLDPGYNLNNASYTYTNNNTSTSPNPLFANANTLGRSDKGIYMWGIRFAPSLPINPQVLSYPFDNNTFNNIEKGMVSITSMYNVRNSTFTNLTYGIRIFNDNSPVQGHTISANIFNLIKPNSLGEGGYMVQIEGGKYDKINNTNQFGDPDLLTAQNLNNIGLYLNNTSNFDITDNNFNRLPVGIVCHNSGSGGGNIRALTRYTNNTGNIFTQCGLSIETWKDNTRLNIKCNTSNNTFPADYGGTNWLNSDGENSLAHQGIYSEDDSRKPAGNKFTPVDLSNHPINDRRQIENNARKAITSGSLTLNVILQYTYNAHQPDALTHDRVPVPVGFINVNTGSAKYQEGYSCKPCIIPYCNAETIIEDDALIAQLQSEYETVESQLDNGQTTVLVNAINKNHPTPDGVLKNMLLNASPLSDEVLTAFIKRPIPTAPGIFKDVVIPNSPVTDTVRVFLNQKLLTLPTGIAQQIEKAQAKQNAFRTLALIRRETELLQTERQMALNNLIIQKLDSGNLLSALALLKQENTVNAKQTLISTYLFNNNLPEAIAALNAFVPATQEENDWKNLMNLQTNLAVDGKTVFDITPVQEQFIRDLAYAPEVTLATVNAQAILRLLYGEEFTLDLSQQSFKLQSNTPADTTQAQSNYFQLYPNPAKNYVEVFYLLPLESEGRLEVFSAIGSKVDVLELQSDKSKYLLKTNNYKQGIYFFKLYLNNKYIETKKVIIIK